MGPWERVGKQEVRGAARTGEDLQPFRPFPLQWYPNPQPCFCAGTHSFLENQEMMESPSLEVFKKDVDMAPQDMG